MAREIERKFAFSKDEEFLKQMLIDKKVSMVHDITQGYLTNASDSLVLRVRRQIDSSTKSGRIDAYGVITIKKNDGLGEGVFELETRIEYAQASKLLEAAVGSLISKRRYDIPLSDDLVAEVDIFRDSLAGLAWVEIEVPSLDTPVPVPSWCDQELTSIKGISNFDLAMIPETVLKRCESLGILK